jgi:glycosyltransferase involved in cell wall biosynthesis
MKLSVVLATYNEEENIRDCLKSIKDLADEIIVVDGQSTDKTASIAKKLGAKVFITKNRPIFHINKQMAIDKAKGDWILQLDADERVSPQLKQEIKDIINYKAPAELADAYYLPRKNFFLGRWLKKGGQYPDHVIRLFKRGRAFLPQKSVHEQMKVKGETDTLKGHLLHYTAPTFQRYLTNANRYTSLTANELKQQHLPTNFFVAFSFIILKPIATFFKLYLRHKGILDGFPGFIFALFSGLHWPIAYMKYWELKHHEP